MAIQDYNKAIRLDPKDARVFYNRGIAWSAKKDYGNAIKDYDEAIRLDPKYVSVFHRFAWLLATCSEEQVRDGKRAIQMATKACVLTEWKSSWRLYVLAEAFAEAGHCDEAEHYQRKASEYPGYRGPVEDDFRQRLELCKQKGPFRQSP